MLSNPEERQAADYVLSLIVEEEARNDQIKRENRVMVTAAAADVADATQVASEQSFNREQVRCLFISSFVQSRFLILYLYFPHTPRYKNRNKNRSKSRNKRKKKRRKRRRSRSWKKRSVRSSSTSEMMRSLCPGLWNNSLSHLEIPPWDVIHCQSLRSTRT